MAIDREPFRAQPNGADDPAGAGTSVLVTGAGGFIEGHVVHELARAGYRVKALTRRAIDHGAADTRAEWVRGDLCNPRDLNQAVAGVRAVVHAAGWVSLKADRRGVSRRKHRKRVVGLIARELAADFAGIPAGRPRVLPDGRLGKFGWKAQFATLEEFVAAACANEIGLGNPRMPQARPLVVCECPDAAPDLDPRQFRALVAFVDTLPRPEVVLPADPDQRAEAGRGRALFGAIGCAACHTPDVGGVAGVYSDFMLHRLDDPDGSGDYGREIPEVPLPDAHPLPAEWKTPPLWGVADSAPYFHDGNSPTLEDAILRHLGDATPATEAYKRLAPRDRAAVIHFLKTLRAPAQADPADGERLALAD